MHPNPAFRKASRDASLDLAREAGFGVLAVNGPDGPLLSHIPFLLSEDGAVAEFHLVRSNPIARLGGATATIAVTGPEGYVSPDWYEVPDQVPTWNYVAVHLRGRLDPMSPEVLGDLLERQSAMFENKLAPKRPWTMDKMTPEVRERMMRQILPFRMEIDEVASTWKLNQNKDDAVRLRAADRIEEAGLSDRSAELAALMRDPP